MRIRRPDRVVAALLLTMLGGSLALLAHPSAASTLESYDIKATVKYGCAQDKGDDNFVEVGLSAVERGRFADHEMVLQVGLAGPDAESYGVFPEGGPSLVTLSEKPTKVRLAGPVHDGDHVFLKQLDQPEIIKLPLQGDCHRIKPTNFGLDEPAVKVSAQSCTTGSRANLKVTLQNPNEVDRRLQKIGIEQIDYTVLLVRQDGLLAGEEPVGTMISFDEPSASSITLSQVAAKPANFQVRVIGLDGAVVSSRTIRLSCASTGPAPTTPARPSPSVSVSSPATPPPTQRPPSSSRPAPSTPARPPTATVSRPPTSPAPTSSAAASTPASSVPAAPATSRPATSRPATSPPASSSSSAAAPRPSSSASRPSTPAPRPSSPAAQPSATQSDVEPTSSAPAGPVTSSPAPSSSTIIRLVEPRPDYGGLPVFQKEVALVVLAFSAAMAALVGTTVVNARRR